MMTNNTYFCPYCQSEVDEGSGADCCDSARAAWLEEELSRLQTIIWRKDELIRLIDQERSLSRNLEDVRRKMAECEDEIKVLVAGGGGDYE